MITDPETLKSLMTEGSLLPQEEMLAIGRKKGKLVIGIPKETSYQENRVALIPDTVQLLVNNGHQVLVESKAGEKLDFKTRTPNILSKKINKKPKDTPIARLDPVPPLLLKEETEIAIIVNMKQERGIVYLL